MPQLIVTKISMNTISLEFVDVVEPFYFLKNCSSFVKVKFEVPSDFKMDKKFLLTFDTSNNCFISLFNLKPMIHFSFASHFAPFWLKVGHQSLSNLWKCTRVCD